jgi:hypothetical protein
MRLGLAAALTCALFLCGCGATLITGTLVASTSNLAFGNVAVGQTASATITFQNQGPDFVRISQLNVSGQYFSSSVGQSSLPLTIAANSSYSLSVQFNPGAAGALAGQLTVTSDASNGTSTAVSFSGTGVPAPSALNCSSGAITGAETVNCTVTLNAAAASGGLTVDLTSNSAAVTVPSTVAVAEGQASANFTATIATVSVAQSVALTANVAGMSQSYALQLGAVAPILNVNTSSLAFGPVNVNSGAAQSVVVTSTGTAPVTVSGATVTGDGFSVAADSLPLTLNPNQTATLTVQFNPTAAGTASGSLTIVSNSSTNPATVVNLSGTGVAPSYAVDLTWDAPTSSPDPVAGYYVYRAPTGGSSYQLLSNEVVTSTAYTDTTVQSGQTYDYIVESVDASGVTSVASNMAVLTIP